MISPELYVIMKSTWKITKEEMDVVDRCAIGYEITTKKLLSNERGREVSTARQCAMFILHKIMKLTQEHVGNILGRDHSTVIHGCRVYADLIRMDVGERDKVKSILKSINYHLTYFEEDYPMISKVTGKPEVKLKQLDPDFGRKVFLGEISKTA